MAVKLARPHLVAHPRARRALAREVAVLRHNPHPVLPRFIHDGVDTEIPHIVVEYVDGESLDDVVDPEPLDADATATLAIALLSALGSVHARGMAHLDVKPENVVIRDGRPVLIDFGLARAIGSEQPAGPPIGTTGYISPEMQACEPISPTMDVYGVGATLREAFSGYSPYADDPVRRRLAADPPYLPGHPTLVDLIKALLNKQSAERPTVPEALDAFADLFQPQQRPWPSTLSAQNPAAPPERGASSCDSGRKRDASGGTGSRLPGQV